MTRWLQGFWKSFKRFLGIVNVTDNSEAIRDHTQSDAESSETTSELTGQSNQRRSPDAGGGPKKRVSIANPPFLEQPRDQPLPQGKRQTEHPETDSEIVKKTPKPAIRLKSSRLDIQVGIDFGTSATKMAYRRLDQRTSVYPIIFSHRLESVPSYCLPSVAEFDESGRLFLGGEAASRLEDSDWDAGIRRLKVLIAAEKDECFSDGFSQQRATDQIDWHNRKFDSVWSIDSLTAAFLAYSMEEAKRQIRRDHPDNELDLRFNVCAPIDFIERNAVYDHYLRVLDVAYELFLEGVDWENQSSLDRRIAELLSKPYVARSKETRRAFVIPEPVAEIASYLYSLERSGGIHAIIDIGAGTTDISIFNLAHLNGGLEARWYASSILPQGGWKIEQIAATLVASKTGMASARQVADYLSDLSSVQREVAKEIEKELNSLWSRGRDTWRTAYSHWKQESHWRRNAVKVFVSGGLSKLDLVHRIFSQSWMCHSGQNWGPYPIDNLPVPNDFYTGKMDIPFHRICVAYGLTIPEPLLEKYILPRDVKDDTPPRLPVRDVGWDYHSDAS